MYGAHWLLVALTVGARARRRRALGHAGRLAAAVPAAAARLRPGDVVGAVCRDAGGRDRAGDLLQRGHGPAAGDVALTLRARRPAAGGGRLAGRQAGGWRPVTHDAQRTRMRNARHNATLRFAPLFGSASCCARLCRASTTRRRTHDRSSSIARPARRIRVAGSATGRRGAAAHRASVQRSHDWRRQSVPPVARENALDQPGEFHRRKGQRRAWPPKAPATQAARDLGVRAGRSRRRSTSKPGRRSRSPTSTAPAPSSTSG